MKKGLVTLFILLAASLLNAQWIQYGFETANADTFFQHPPANAGLGTGSGSLILTDISSNPEPYHGAGA